MTTLLVPLSTLHEPWRVCVPPFEFGAQLCSPPFAKVSRNSLRGLLLRVASASVRRPEIRFRARASCSGRLPGAERRASAPGQRWERPGRCQAVGRRLGERG